MTDKGYVKRLPQDTYRTQRRGGRGVTGVTMRDEDVPLHMLSANTHDYLLVFTNRGRVYQIKVHELPDASRTAKGIPIVNVIGMQPDESVTTLLKVRDYTEAKLPLLHDPVGTGEARCARPVPYRPLQWHDRHRAWTTSDELAWVRMTSGEDHVVLVSTNGQAIRFDENDVRPMGRPAAGVIGIRLGRRTKVIAFEVVEPDRELLVVAGRGTRQAHQPRSVTEPGTRRQGHQAMNLAPKDGQDRGRSHGRAGGRRGADEQQGHHHQDRRETPSG